MATCPGHRGLFPWRGTTARVVEPPLTDDRDFIITKKGNGETPRERSRKADLRAFAGYVVWPGTLSRSSGRQSAH